MTNTQQIRFVAREPVTKYVQVPDHYTFRQDKPYHWLQKAAVGLLKKLGCEAQVLDPAPSFKTITIDTHKVVDYIARQRALVETICYKQAKRLLIGPKELNEALCETSPVNTSIDFPVQFQMWDHRYGTRLVGLIVTVVPWMEGVLVLPEDDHTKLVELYTEAQKEIASLKEEVKKLTKRLLSGIKDAWDPWGCEDYS